MTSTRYTQALVLSSVLHAVVVAIGLILTWRVSDELKTTPAFFEMVANGAPTAREVGSALAIVIPALTIQGEDAAPPRTTPSITRPRPDASTKPTPTSSKRPAPNPNGDGRGGPATEKPRSESPQAPRVPHVDTTWSFRPTPTTALEHGANSGGMATALDVYFAELRRRLRDEIITPPDVAAGRVTAVDVLILANGTLSDPRIVESSGSAAFDRAVLEAIARTKMGPRPDGRSERVTIPFRARVASGER